MFLLRQKKSLKRKKLLAQNSVFLTYPAIEMFSLKIIPNPPQCHPCQEIRRPHCRRISNENPLVVHIPLVRPLPFLLLQCPVSASRIPSMMSHCWCKCSSLRPLSPVSKWVTWGLTRVENFPEIVNPWYGIYIYIYYAISRPMTYIYI